MAREVNLMEEAEKYIVTVKKTVEGVVKKKKVSTIQIKNTGDINLITSPEVSFARIGEERRGMTDILTGCGCVMLIATEYLWSKKDEGEAIEHNHRERGVYV
jgi:hypothetical protein